MKPAPYDTIGRPLKVDRQEVIAVIVALREWFSMDHEARLSGYKRKSEELLSNSERTSPHIAVQILVTDARSLSNGVHITVDETALGKTAAQIIEELRQGNPSVWTRGSANTFRIAVTNFIEDDQEIVTSRLRDVLTRINSRYRIPTQKTPSAK